MTAKDSNFSDEYKQCLAGVEELVEVFMDLSGKIAPKVGDEPVLRLERLMMEEVLNYYRSQVIELRTSMSKMSVYLERMDAILLEDVLKEATVRNPALNSQLSRHQEKMSRGPFFLNEAHETHTTKAQVRRERAQAKKAKEKAAE